MAASAAAAALHCKLCRAWSGLSTAQQGSFALHGVFRWVYFIKYFIIQRGRAFIMLLNFGWESNAKFAVISGCQIKGDFPLTNNHWFSCSCYSETALFGWVKVYEKKDAASGLYECFHALWASQAKLTVIKVIQWQLVLLCLSLESYFRPYILQTGVSVSGAAAPESSCCPGGRDDFLLRGASRTSAAWQTQLGELLALNCFGTFLTSRCVGLYFLPAKCSVDMDRVHCSLLSALGCYPAAVMGMITGQQHQSSSRASWGWRVRMKGSLPRPPATHREGTCTAKNNTGIMLNETFLQQDIQLKSIKGTFTQKWKFCHYLLNLVMMKSQVKFCRPEKLSLASQRKKLRYFPKQLKSIGITTKKQTWIRNGFIRCNPSLQKPWDPELIYFDIIIYTLDMQSSLRTHFIRGVRKCV